MYSDINKGEDMCVDIGTSIHIHICTYVYKHLSDDHLPYCYCLFLCIYYEIDIRVSIRMNIRRHDIDIGIYTHTYIYTHIYLHG
jgi:hypothetical protein